MNTPICDFVRQYNESSTLRLHMPGHKGKGCLGIEGLDITEIAGADSLYEADGIIRRSEENASRLFWCPTFYSTEGSSQCIRAMLYLCLLHAKRTGKRPLIAAGRNAHKVLLSAAALLGMDIEWLYPEDGSSYLSCAITAEGLDQALSNMSEKPVAVFVTSPDYLGNMLDIFALAEVAHNHSCLLAVDCAHGAYLHFMPPSMHPMALDADLCCSSAHKTLPVLTGGAYLHTTRALQSEAKRALALFGSTSPSYLILQSLDEANAILIEDYKYQLPPTASLITLYKTRLSEAGFRIIGDEPLKLTIDAKAYGYTGVDLARLLRQMGIECEFSDPDYLVLMVTPETGAAGLRQLEDALTAIPQRPPLTERPPRFHKPQRILSIREAMLSPSECIPVSESQGRILAAATVGCPPAVPIIVCGEQIDTETIERFRYYGIDTCWVVSE